MIRNGYRQHRRLGQSAAGTTADPNFSQQTPYNLIPDVPGETIVYNGNTYSWSNGQWVSPGQASITPIQSIPSPTASPVAAPATPIIVTPALVSPAPLVSPPAPSTAPANYSAQEIAGSFNYTADLETVQNEMDLYGDTWDNAQTIVNDLYSSGITPGTVTPAIAFSMLSGLAAATTTTAPASLLSSIGAWPWYYWAALAGGGLLLLGGGKARK